jgi:NadR type nicotinamide-nucleotide adenylyltransferase
MKKVVLTGSESSGKTDLAQALGAHFDVPVSTEFVREFAARQGSISFADHGTVARGQMASEDAAIVRASDLVILDTDLVSTVVYCEHYFGRSPDWIAEEARKRAGDLYLLMQPDIPWVADGIRDRGDRRDEMHQLFAVKLAGLGLRFVEIGGSRAERLRSAVQAIETTAAKHGSHG